MAHTETAHTDKLYSKEETTNYCRIILLMVDVGTQTLLHLFYSCVPKSTVKAYFASKKSEIERKRKKVFDESQYAKLTCPDPNPDEFDISLLIKLLTVFSLSPVKLHSLQKIRNEIIGHKSRAELTKQYFEHLWVQVENILLAVAKYVSGDAEKETKLKVEELKQKVLDVSDREKKIIKAFETWCQEKITLLQEKIDSVQEDVTEKTGKNRESIESLKEQVNKMTDKMQKLIKSLHDLASGSQHPATRQYTRNVLQQDLIAYYRKWFSRLTISPLIDEDEYAVNFLEVYVKPILAIPSHQGTKVPRSQPVKSCHDIFVKDSKACQNIYISSPAGCGKTSLTSWLALTWCQAHQPIEKDNKWFNKEDVDEMRTFMFVFVVFLRDWHEQECDVDIMIQNQLLCKLASSTTYTEIGLKFLQNLFSSVKCIIILDGLDEWNHPRGNGCMLHNKQTPYIRARPLCTTLTTSRPWKLDVVGLKPGEIDQKLELNGLEGVLFQRLVSNVVTKLNKLHGKDMQENVFRDELQDKKLMTLSKIPLVVMQLLTVWFDNEQLGESRCEIYSNMIEFLLKRYCKKKEIDSEIEDMEVDDWSRDRQIPMCLQNQMYCQSHKELLYTLATFAYNTLFTNNKESSLVCDRKIAKKYLSNREIKMSLALGILTQERVLDKISVKRSNISFIHKTFQEYFAALHVTLNPGMVTKVAKNIKYVCSSIEKILEMSQLFMFLSGLCPGIMVNLHEHLRKTVSGDSRTQRFRDLIVLEPEWGLSVFLEVPRSSEGRTLKQVQDTMVVWLGECWLNGHKDVTHLPVSDFFIWSPYHWSAVLKSLIVNNPVCSLHVCGVNYSPEEIEDILNSVTAFRSIQKLWLCGVTETFVVQLVCQHKCSLSLSPETWGHLGCVTLRLVEIMSGDILCSLVEAILKLPQSVQVRLQGCGIRLETRYWNSYIHSHDRLTVDNEDVKKNKSSMKRTRNVILLQFHTDEVSTCLTI